MRAPAPTPCQRLDQWLTPSWIETGSGFPTGALGVTCVGEPEAPVTIGDGLILTEHLVGRAVAFGEFLAGHRFDAADRATTRAATVEEFETDPLGVTRNLVDVAGAVARVPDLSPVVRARLRHRALSTIAALDHGDGFRSVSATMRCVYQYNPVVAVGAGSTVVVEDAVLAWREFRSFVADVAGSTMTWNEAAFRARIDEGFDRWPPAQQDALAEAHPALIATRVGLRRLAPDDREDLAEAIAGQATTPAGAEAGAVALASVGRVHDLIQALRQGPTAAADSGRAA